MPINNDYIATKIHKDPWILGKIIVAEQFLDHDLLKQAESITSSYVGIF